MQATATLNLNLAEGLSAPELATLLEIARTRKVSIERVLYEAATDLAERQRAGAAQLQLPISTTLGKGGA